MPSHSDEQPYPEPMGNILLVDDDPTVRGVVSHYLRAAGHSITEASVSMVSRCSGGSVPMGWMHR